MRLGGGQRVFRWCAAVLAATAVGAGCGLPLAGTSGEDTPVGAPDDASTESAADEPQPADDDGSADAAPDVVADAPGDAPVDAPADGGDGSPPDASLDAFPDAPADAPPDVSPEVGAPVDAGPDAGPDATPDATPDAPSDATLDASALPPDAPDDVSSGDAIGDSPEGSAMDGADDAPGDSADEPAADVSAGDASASGDVVAASDATLGSCASCPTGDLCVAGVCVASCAPGLVACDGSCVDPSTNGAHCGASGDCSGASSGTDCGAADSCVSGRCTEQIVLGPSDLVGQTLTQDFCAQGSYVNGVDTGGPPPSCEGSDLAAHDYGFQWTDNGALNAQPTKVTLTFAQGIACDPGSQHEVRLGATTVGAFVEDGSPATQYTSSGDCACATATVAATMITVDDPAVLASYVPGGANSFEIGVPATGGDVCEGLAPIMGQTFAVVTVVY